MLNRACRVWCVPHTCYRCTQAISTTLPHRALRLSRTQNPSQLDLDFQALIDSLEEEMARNRRTARRAEVRDRTILVGVATGSLADAEESMAELAELAASAGVVVQDRDHSTSFGDRSAHGARSRQTRRTDHSRATARRGHARLRQRALRRKCDRCRKRRISKSSIDRS